MYLKKTFNKKTGRTYLSIVKAYRDKDVGHSKTVTVKSLGYLDELEKEYLNPIDHFKKAVIQMNKDEVKTNFIITVDKTEVLKKNTSTKKNLGYAALSKIYHELEIDKFIINRQRHLKIDYNLNNVMKLLVFSRLLFPSSKKKTFENKDIFFENTNFSIYDVYNTLTYINKHINDLQKFIYDHVKKQYGESTDIVYYDVTNYYFEIDEQDELRRKGVSKEHRKDPIIQMGLLMDGIGMPISYKLFEGNANDCTTLVPVLTEIRRTYNLGKLIIVADKGLNTSNNIYYNKKRKNGYVFSQSVRKATKELKSYVLNENGYTWIGKNFKRKSRLYPRQIEIQENGNKKKITVDEKQVVFYSRDYDKRAKAERASTVSKARELVKNPTKYTQATSYGAAKYVKNLTFDKKTREIITEKKIPTFDEEKLKEEEKFDGYYAIVTSEWKKTDDKIIEIYRGLWKIEESFKITKSDLETRPVYLSRKDRIESHFLICYISLVIARIIQYRIDNKYYVSNILESLAKVCCSYISENTYLFEYRNDVIDAIGEVLKIDFSRKYMTIGEIKKILGEVKKIN